MKDWNVGNELAEAEKNVGAGRGEGRQREEDRKDGAEALIPSEFQERDVEQE